jgi:hypothetical protein
MVSRIRSLSTEFFASLYPIGRDSPMRERENSVVGTSGPANGCAGANYTDWSPTANAFSIQSPRIASYYVQSP